MDHDVGNDAPATATQMVVGHADPPPGPGRVAGDDGARDDGARDDGPGRRPWPMVAGVVLVLVAAALVLARPSERPDVQVRDWRAAAWVTAPAAPSGPIAERWSHAVPADRDLLGFAAVDGHVVVASRDRLPSPEGNRVVVESFDTRDGTRTWRREVPDRDTVIMVSDGAETHLLANVMPFGDPEGRAAWGGSGVAMLDAATGGLQWTTDLDRDAGVEVQPNGDVVVQDASGVRMVDPRSGATRLSWPALDVGDDDSADGRRAWREGGAWIVPTPDGWEIADDDGTVEFAVPGANTWPAVDRDVVVVGDGSRVVARRRPGGEIAWRAELGDRLLWIDLLDRGVRGPDDPVRLVAHLGDGPPGDDQALMQERSVLVVDGRVVGPWDPRTASAPTSLGRLSVEVDGRRLVACRSLPPEFGPASAATCPADLALLDGDEEVLATADAPPAATVPSMVIGGWQATDAGLVVIGEEEVVLRGWADLSATWEVDLPANATVDQATVVTTTRGVAISAPGSDPPRVTWYG